MGYRGMTERRFWAGATWAALAVWIVGIALYVAHSVSGLTLANLAILALVCRCGHLAARLAEAENKLR